MGWLVLAVGLHYLAPPWDRITKDDDLRLFPKDSPSVIGHSAIGARLSPGCLELRSRAFLRAQEWSLDSRRLPFRGRRGIEPFAARPEHPELGVEDDRDAPLTGDRSPVDRSRAMVGPGGAVDRLAGQWAPVPEGAARGRPDPGAARHRAARPPPGISRAVTGSAAVGHDTNTATDESIENTTIATIALVILILLVVYRSPLLAMVPLVTIAFSVFASLRLIALLTAVPGLGFQVIDITQIFVVVVLFGAGTDYCLFLVARYREELERGRSPVAALLEAIGKVGAALGRQCRDCDRRAGDASASRASPRSSTPVRRSRLASRWRWSLP